MAVIDFDPEKWSRSNPSEAPPQPAKVAELAKIIPGKRLNSQLSQLSQPAVDGLRHEPEGPRPMSYLERLQAKAAMNAAGEALKGAKAPSDPFEGDDIGSYWGLPADMVMGLRKLATMPTPRLILSEGWPAAVSDALMLTTDGWAEKALALGWSPLEIFGAVTDRDGYSGADGLAVWLGGRPVLAIADTYASVGDGIGRAYFNRSTCLAETLLWDIGREAVR